jgi:hypothetical protein
MLIRRRSPAVVASTSDSFSRYHRQPPEWQYRQATCQRYPNSTSFPPSGHARSFCRKREMMNSVDWNEREHGSRYDCRSANLSLVQLQNQDLIQARNGIPRCADSTTSTCGETTCRTETAAIGRGRSSRTGIDHEWCERDEVDRWTRRSNGRTIVRRLQVMEVMVLTRRLLDLANRYRNKTRNW